MWVGGGGLQALCLPLLLNPGAARDRAKTLRCPGLGCPGARGGAASSLCATVVTRVWARG
jgi:hypothetical protein